MSGRVEIPDLSGIVSRIRKAVEAGVREAAKQVPERITDHLRSGRKPDGTAQPPNADSTLASKRRKGQGSTPGVADGLLSDPTRWTVTFDQDGATIQAPPDRFDAIEYNRPRDYEFVGIPEETRDDLDREIKRALKGVR
jgi:hypothetical protein